MTTQLKILTVGGSGKLGSFCINKWISQQEVSQVWNFDKISLKNNNVCNIKKDILTDEGYELLIDTLRNNQLDSIIIFAGYDFPMNSKNNSFSSPYEPSKEIANIAWEINCVIPYLVIRAADSLGVRNLNLTLIGSIYGDQLPKMNLYSAEGDKYKPVVYGMCKNSLQYLMKQASISMAKFNGRCNLIRFGGIELGISKEFNERYASLSPLKKMVSIDSVYETLTFVSLKKIDDLNGAIIDLDSGFRHI